QQREHAFMQAAFLDGFTHGAADQLGRAGVGGVALDDDGSAGSQRSSGIAARDRESQGEVAGAEYGHRADRDVLQAQVAARQRLALRQRLVDARIDPVAAQDFAREQAELAHGAAALALQAGDRQTRFLVRALDQRIAQRLDVLGYAFQEGGALLQRSLAV